MKTSHTPGPWKVETYHGPLFKIIRDRGPDDTPEYRVEADRLLIAAAPEMLSALENALSCIDQHTDDEVLGPIIEQARAALKKAKGDV